MKRAFTKVRLLILFRIRMKVKFFNNCVAFSILISGILFTSPLSFSEKPSEQSKAVNLADMLKERRCITSALFHEARGEPEIGQRAVLSVIYNRKEAKGFPSTFCGVIKAPSQFSYLNGVDKEKKMLVKPFKQPDREVYSQVSSLADEAVLGYFKPVLDPSVLWYSHTRVRNNWTEGMKVVKIYGNHKFMKEK